MTMHEDPYWTPMAYAARTMQELSCVSVEVVDGCLLLMRQRRTGLTYQRLLPERMVTWRPASRPV